MKILLKLSDSNKLVAIISHREELIEAVSADHEIFVRVEEFSRAYEVCPPISGIRVCCQRMTDPNYFHSFFILHR